MARKAIPGFARRVKVARLYRKKSVQQAAKMSGMTAVSWARIEDGNVDCPRIQSIYGIARALLFNAHWLLTGAGKELAPRKDFKDLDLQ